MLRRCGGMATTDFPSMAISPRVGDHGSTGRLRAKAIAPLQVGLLLPCGFSVSPTNKSVRLVGVVKSVAGTSNGGEPGWFNLIGKMQGLVPNSVSIKHLEFEGKDAREAQDFRLALDHLATYRAS